MSRLAAAAVLCCLTLSGSALAMMSESSLDGAQAPSAVPEPAAALLFAAGIGIGAWTIRRRSR